MELTLDEAQTKALLKEIVIELMQEKHDWFYGILVEALEEVGLANAIRAGRRDEFVDEADVAAVLEGRA
jgi:hypothetical protein